MKPLKRGNIHELAAIGKFSDQTITKVANWIIDKFKNTLNITPSSDKYDELILKLRGYDIANIIQYPVFWYINGTPNRACFYGNKIAISTGIGSKDFATLGLDSKGVIAEQAYDMYAMAHLLFPGEKQIKDCGAGIRIEVEAYNQAGNLTNFAHILNSGYPYDKAIQDEIRRRSSELKHRCSDPATTIIAIKSLMIKLEEICPLDKEKPGKITLLKPSRQPKSAPATHFKLNYTYLMMTHSGKIIDRNQIFRVEIRNEGIKLVIDDISSYIKTRKSDAKLRKIYARQRGIKFSQLATNMLKLITHNQLDQLLKGGIFNFNLNNIHHHLAIKNLKVEAIVYLPGIDVKEQLVEVYPAIPQTIAHSLVGESLRRVIEHPLITDDMIITKAIIIRNKTRFTYKSHSTILTE